MYMCYKLSWISQDHPIAILDVKAFSLSNLHLAIWGKNPQISEHHLILWQVMIPHSLIAIDIAVMSWYNLPSFLSHLCLSPTPSPSPSNSIQPHPPAFCHLHSNSEVYSCNYATSALGLASD